MRTKLFLIRHGVTHWNKQKRYCGSIDVPLSREGRTQAKRLAQRLCKLSIDTIYVSDKKRALQTAHIIFSGAPMTIMAGLREIDFGVFEGLRHREILRKYPDVYTRWLNDPFTHDIPGAESLRAFKERVTTTLEKIVARNTGKNIGIVSHGGAISIFVSTILKNKNFWHHIPGATSLSIVEYDGGTPKIKLFNCSKHLEDTHG